MRTISRIIPLGIFRKNTREALEEIETSGEPIILTRHGRGAFVVQSIDSYMEFERFALHAGKQFLYNKLNRGAHDYGDDDEPGDM